MLAYIYTPEECGLTEFSSGILQLEGVTPTRTPSWADVFVCPEALRTFKALDHFPYIAQYPNRHVFLDLSEDFTRYPYSCIYIRAALTQAMLKEAPLSIAWPWPVDDFSEYSSIPTEGFTHDVSFHGWNWSEARQASVAVLQSTPSLSCDFKLYDNFTGYLSGTHEFARRRLDFALSMEHSRLALCPESIPGVIPYRFYEALSCARIPVLVGSDYVLPFADEIPYDTFIVRCSVQEIPQLGSQLRDYLDRTTDIGLTSRGRVGQGFWRNLLKREKWPELMTYAVEQKIGL